MQSINEPLLGRLQSKWKCNEQFSVCSKSVFLILTWNFLVSFAAALFTSPDFYGLITGYSSSANLIKATTFGLSGFLLLFFPLATCLADRRWGRYKTIVYSLYCLTCTATVMCVLGGALGTILVKNVGSQTLYVGLGVPILVAFILTLFSLVAFTANAFQFGADQLIYCPSDHCNVYVYWYVWTSCAGTAFQQFMLSLASNVTTKTASELKILFILIPICAIIILGVTLVIQRFKHHWFNWFINVVIDSSPYKLTYKVSSFAIKHKRPLQRSAFTYCDDELPTRFDLGKKKFGGPFTTEQVEDVKTFLKMLRVLLVLGPIFAVEIAADNQLPTVAYHLAGDFSSALLRPAKEACSITYPTMLALNGSITPLIITSIIPLYMYLLRPFIKHHTPKMLKQIGLGIMALTLSLISTLLLDTAGHIRSSNTTCFFNSGLHFNGTCDLVESPSVSPLYIIIPYTLNAFAYMFLYIGSYKFILSQSPHAMKGLIIGLFFAIKGLFQLVAVLTVYLPFISWSSDSSFPSCGFVYYLTNLAIALTGIVAYSCISKRYKYRTRDEPSDTHIYAEVYYTPCRSIEQDENLVYKVEDDDNSQWVCTEPEEGKKSNHSSTSQATIPHTQDNATGSKRQRKIELPDHISSRNKSESD
jgi:peptide/histidine transporter 3/4